MNLQKAYELRLAERALSGKGRKHIEKHREALISASSCSLFPLHER